MQKGTKGIPIGLILVGLAAGIVGMFAAPAVARQIMQKRNG